MSVGTVVWVGSTVVSVVMSKMAVLVGSTAMLVRRETGQVSCG